MKLIYVEDNSMVVVIGTRNHEPPEQDEVIEIFFEY